MFFTENSFAKTPSVAAKHAAVFDITSGEFIYRKNSRTLVPPASTIKILTAMVIIDRFKTDRVITVPSSVIKVSPYKLYLKPKQKYKVIDLLYALLIRSANDAAHVLAVRSYGSETKFAKAMNAKAEKIGCTMSEFRNPHGLPNEKQRTTAADISLITAFAYKNYPLIREIMSTRKFNFKYYQGEEKRLDNRNKLLIENFKPPVYGKTGYTRRAGRCFTGYIKGKTPVVVTLLNSNARWVDLKKMAAWSHRFYINKILTNKKRMTPVEVRKTQQLLKKLGFLNGKVDGVFGTKTQAAVLKFQSTRKIKVDGIVGQHTMSMLEKN